MRDKVMKKKLIILFLIGMFIFLFSGCSKTADEEQIKANLEEFENEDILEENEKIKKIIIDKRKTEKKKKRDEIWCTMVTENEEVLREKEIVLRYGLYDKGWILDNVEVNDSEEWIVKPLKGVGKELLVNTLTGEFIGVEDAGWEIKKNEIKEITINNQHTDLEKGKDVLDVSLELESIAEIVKVELNISYVFDEKWEIENVEELGEFNYEDKEIVSEISEERMISDMVRSGIYVGAWEDPIVIDGEEAISNFKINEIYRLDKGKYRRIFGSAVINNSAKRYDVDIQWNYEYSENNKNWNGSARVTIKE